MPSPLGFLIKTTGIYATADSSALGDPIKADDVNQKKVQTDSCQTLCNADATSSFVKSDSL